MIERYSRPEMTALFQEEEKFLRWLEVEAAVCVQQSHSGMIPKSEGRKLHKRLIQILRRGKIDARAISKFEARTKHDVLAFTEWVAKKAGPSARYLHFGLTSSDVVDTALALSVQRAGSRILVEIGMLKGALKKRAREHQGLLAIGRTHGVFAEATSFGMKFLGFYTEVERAEKRIQSALEQLRYGKLSGAVGANARIPLSLEKKILSSLGLKREPVATQVIPRDRLAELFAAVGIFSGTMERICTEFRHLQRTEVGEAREGFSKGQKGSSAMPHKRNPIGFENLTGVARILRSYCGPAMENIALWHERDISHSSVERVIVPDMFILLDYSIHRLTGLIEKLEIDSTRVKENREKAREMSASGTLLLKLVEKGIKREAAYKEIQRTVHAAIDTKTSWRKILERDSYFKNRVDAKTLDAIFSDREVVRGVNQAFQEVLKNGRSR